VYAVVVVIIYPWSLLQFFDKLPSWLYYSSAGEIAVIFAYMVVVNLIESLLVLLAPILMSIVLPRNWFYERFVTRGTLFVLSGFSYLIFFNTHLNTLDPFPLKMVYWTPVIVLVILALVFLIDWLGFLDKILNGLADRLTIFVYISIPVSIVSLLVVVFRNIL
jgi:hypothetical protein